MATKTTNTTQATEKKEFKLTQAFALWKNTSKDGKKTYFTGGTDAGLKITAFYNTRKKNPKEPDMRIYAVEGEKRELSKETICSLWCNVSEKTKKKFLTGSYNGKKVIGFINDGKNEKAPYLSVYYREDGNFVKEEKEEEQVTIDDDLPF